MNRNFLKVSIMLFAVALIFSACNKSNVKYGNKRIIGTWTLASQTSESSSSINESTIYTPSHCYYYNTTEVTTSTSSTSLTGNTYSKTSVSSFTYNGGTPNTTNIDTTYTVDQSMKFTFNEDGTFVYENHNKETEDGDTDYYYGEEKGTWNWVDSYKEKAGISISFGEGGSEMLLIIKELKKDELEFTYTYSSKSERESSYSGECYDYQTGNTINFTRKDMSKRTSTESGTRVMTK